MSDQKKVYYYLRKFRGQKFFFGYGKKIFGGLLFAQNVEICSNKTKNSWFLQELQFSFLVNSNS